MKVEYQSSQNLISQGTKTSIAQIYNITSNRRKFITTIQSSMHEQFDEVMEQKQHQCICCHKIFKGKKIGAHYRNEQRCKYLKDRSWLKEVPVNWRQDLEQFKKDNQIL